MKKIITILFISILLFTMLPSINVSAAVKLNKTKVTLELDSTIKLTVSGTKLKPTWKSSKSDIAKVDKSGNVVGIKVGRSTVSATVNKIKYSCIVYVVDTNSDTLTAKKGTITTLETGTYVIGEDFPSGKYNVTIISGTGNFIVLGDDTYVNEVMSEKSDVNLNTHGYKNLRLMHGDEMKIMGGLVLELTKLD